MAVTQAFARVQHAIHKYYIWITATSYLCAAFLPGLGQNIRGVSFTLSLGATSVTLPLSLTMLGFLLFNAGLGIKAREIGQMLRQPLLVIVAMAANMGAPLCFMLAATQLLSLWQTGDAAQQIVAGLALISSLPVAAASSAWTQNANGNLTLSLGLILLTTLLSPVLTPLVLTVAASFVDGDYATTLVKLAQNDAGAFLGTWIIFPSLAGMALHWLLGEKRVLRLSPYLKLVNSVVLVLINYAYASATFPGLLARPDPGLIGLMLLIVASLCLSMFGLGYAIGRALKLPRAETASLMFGLGMNNNVAGLALASLAFAKHPGVLTPIILYNLTQHLVAATVDKLISREDFASARPAAAE